MFFLFTRKLYLKWTKFFVQFRCLSLYQNDLYRNDRFPKSPISQHFQVAHLLIVFVPLNNGYARKLHL